MPIEIQADLRRPTPEDFAKLSYDVVACAFSAHNELGKFCDEHIYKQTAARRLGGVQLEVPIVVRHRDFYKLYLMDMLVRGMAVFEWKTVECFTPAHRAQLLNYLLLSDLPKGKLINMRNESVEHEFVNTTLRPVDRRLHCVNDAQFDPQDDLDHSWREFLISAVEDWGTGLDVRLYEAAIAHVLSADPTLANETQIVVDGIAVGRQSARLSSPSAIYRVTTLNNKLSQFELHAKRLLQHTPMRVLHWINITRNCITLKTIQRH